MDSVCGREPPPHQTGGGPCTESGCWGQRQEAQNEGSRQGWGTKEAPRALLGLPAFCSQLARAAEQAEGPVCLRDQQCGMLEGGGGGQERLSCMLRTPLEEVPPPGSHLCADSLGEVDRLRRQPWAGRRTGRFPSPESHLSLACQGFALRGEPAPGH